MIRYSVWLDQATDTYEVVRWIGKDSHEVVQRNILTIEKAYRARDLWKAREEGKNADA
jgi:hypothetical protein